jgi:hypothetical protein
MLVSREKFALNEDFTNYQRAGGKGKGGLRGVKVKGERGKVRK